jgi:hypothetical protein
MKKILIYIVSSFYCWFGKTSFDRYIRALGVFSLVVLLSILGLINLLTKGVFIRTINELPEYISLLIFAGSIALLYVSFKYLIPEKDILALKIDNRNRFLNDIILFLSLIIWGVILIICMRYNILLKR